MTEVKQTQETYILASLARMTDPKVSAFRNVARPILAMDFAIRFFEMYGKGQPQFNTRVKALIEAGKVIRAVKGKSTYYSLPQAI